MVHGGLCLSTDGALGTVMVAGAIPGELAEVRLHHRARNTWFADVQRVLEASPDRVDAPCPYLPACGGCQLQHVSYQRQLQLKREIVEDALRRQHIAVPVALGMHGMRDPWRYRVRGEFHVIRGASDGVALGFNRARSWQPIAVDDCLIHDARITGALPALREVVRRSGTGGMRTMLVTAGDGGELLLRANPPAALRAETLAELASDGSGPTWSTEWTALSWRGRLFRIRSDTFIQVNWQQMDVLYGLAIRALGDPAGARIVDAYAGVGVLACVLAGAAREVVCIESNRAAARAGLLNAQVNDVAERVRYVARPVEDALPQVAGAEQVDALILDPPRAGCDGRVTAWLALAGPPAVVYVSCDPATLARDLHVLVASGPYRIASLDVVDMFAQTYHVETVVGLTRSG